MTARTVHESETSGVEEGRSRRPRLTEAAERFTLPVLLLAVIVYFSLDPGTSGIFATTLNLNTVLGNQAVLAVLALGSIVPLVAGQFDLSVGAVLGCSSLVTGAAIADAHLPVLVAVLMGVGFGVLVGLLNGFLVAYVGVNAFVGTLGVSTVLAGLAIAYSPNPIIDIPTSMTDFGRLRVLDLTILAPLVVVFALLLFLMLDYTAFGRRLTAVGSSDESHWV